MGNQFVAFSKARRTWPTTTATSGSWSTTSTRPGGVSARRESRFTARTTSSTRGGNRWQLVDYREIQFTNTRGSSRAWGWRGSRSPSGLSRSCARRACQTESMRGRQPFAGEARVSIVLPESDPALGGSWRCWSLSGRSSRRSLGAPVEFDSGSDPGVPARGGCSLSSAAGRAAATVWDAAAGRDHVTWRGRRRALRGAQRGGRRVRKGGYAEARSATALEEAIARVVDEVADTYPAFELHGLDWGEICARHVDEVRAAADPLPAFQALARRARGLAHVGLGRPFGNMPYVGAARSTVDDALAHVPPGSGDPAASSRAGASSAIDDAEVDAEGWRARTAAPPHSAPVPRRQAPPRGAGGHAALR